MVTSLFNTVRTQLNALNKRNYITYNNKSNLILDTKFGNHPIILSGVLRPEAVKMLGLDPNIKYYIINQVSHKHQDKFHQEMINLLPNFNLKGDIMTAQYTKGFYIIPENILLQGMNTKVVILKDGGINMQQEELITKNILNDSKLDCKLVNKMPCVIYDPIKQKWESYLLNHELFILFSMEQKIQFFELKTGYKYDNAGNIILQPVIKPANSLIVLPNKNIFNEPYYNILNASVILATIVAKAEHDSQVNKVASIGIVAALNKKANETSNIVNISNKTGGYPSDV